MARVTEAPGTYHAGFILGPRVNAGGRVGEAAMGVRLLTCDDVETAQALARQLDQFNRDRQILEARVLEEAIDQAEADKGAPVLLVASDGWHPGVIGIVASRLAERYNRPVCVVAFSGPEGKGSGRSVPGVGLGAAVIAARQAGLLINGGGHPMAAGFTVRREKLADLRSFLSDRIGAEINENGVTPTLHLDGALTLMAASAELGGPLEVPEPVERARWMGAEFEHVMCGSILEGRPWALLHATAIQSGYDLDRVRSILTTQVQLSANW